ncbi:outer membrane lipoprotein [Vibrio nigripulchritudo]|uniref:glycine zipper 2TM domain-containing protein n=1 Tax=Vibrio nigripulchritudo TaxID=28173 RepID=UPI0024921D32|nr:glycine zipper 2TM domain-containing protein [Vibrio nigripulchritudo]BDU36808.1 outer membrane protein [Vibrio nigripulchritudo]BDU42518.1 outer membrane protein [Vibrio nigripulchritudo]
MRKILLLLLIIPVFVQAGYQRNQARTVNEVVFGQVDSVRYITKQQIIKSKSSGWETLAGATIGGLIGNQFGGGTGKQVATVVGAVAGGSIAHNKANEVYRIEHKLVEILIDTEKGELINVIQDVDPNMLFTRGDSVRILYFDNGVRVDKTY